MLIIFIHLVLHFHSYMISILTFFETQMLPSEGSRLTDSAGLMLVSLLPTRGTVSPFEHGKYLGENRGEHLRVGDQVEKQELSFPVVEIVTSCYNRFVCISSFIWGAFLVKDDRVLNLPLARSLRSRARSLTSLTPSWGS